MARSRRSRRGRRSQSSLPVGDSVTIGRRREPASRRLRLLPRSMPVGLLAGVTRALRRPPRRLPLRAIGSRRVLSDAERRFRIRRAERFYGSLLRHPRLRKQTTVCERRQARKGVLFSRGVAGRSWSGGGPDMRDARRGLSSAFTCRR